MYYGSIQTANRRHTPFRKKDVVVLFAGIIFLILGVIFSYKYAMQQSETPRTILVFGMGIFGAIIVTGVFSALAELSYLIFKYPKDWNSLEYVKEETQEDQDENSPQNI